MKTGNQIDITTFIPADLESVWKHSSTPTGLVELTPKIFGLVLQEPGEIQKGSRLRLGLKVPGLGRIVDWIAHVVDCVDEGPRRYFVDVQEKGPFKAYRHQHIFEAGEGGTWVRDIIDFTSPLWSPHAFTRMSLEKLARGRHENLRIRALML
ncbi:MAG: SRPBCC family protein [Bdellovibrionota bacterium]